MRKFWKAGLICLLFFLLAEIKLFNNTDIVYAGTLDSASEFYNNYGDGIVYNDGYFYFATKGKAASSSRNTTKWGTVGYRLRLDSYTHSTDIYIIENGTYSETISHENIDGYIYELCQISLEYVKYKMLMKDNDAYNEFISSGGNIIVDSCMVTISVDGDGNHTYNGSMDEDGNFAGGVYTDYDGIANAAPWSNPSSLTSYFNKSIYYQTDLRSRQVVYVRYQQTDGNFGDYSAVIDADYVYGEAINWSSSENECYMSAGVSYNVTGANTSYIDVYRKSYTQSVYVKYQGSSGNYSNDWSYASSRTCYYGSEFSWTSSENDCYKSAEIRYSVTGEKVSYIYVNRKTYYQSVFLKFQDSSGNYSNDWSYGSSEVCYYGSEYSWSFAGTDCFKSVGVTSYTVTGDKINYVYIGRNQYTVSINAGTGVASVTGAGIYYYGAKCSINATVKQGYTWNSWTGYMNTTTKQYSFYIFSAASLTANATANTYYVVFNANGGTGNMSTMTCKYDQTYTLNPNVFVNNSMQCTYVGWSTNKNALRQMYDDRNQVKNLTSINGAVITLYAVWDQAPKLSGVSRYFTLSESHSGKITEEELLSTASTTDREDTSTDIYLKNYSENEFLQFQSAGSASMTYVTEDSIGNKVEKTIVVYIVDTDDSKEGDIDSDGTKSYVRFIDEKYLMEDPGNGGLEETSVWRSNPEYNAVLAKVLNNTKGEDGNWKSMVQSWEFKNQDVEDVKKYVDILGMGNSQYINALEGFIYKFQYTVK